MMMIVVLTAILSVKISESAVGDTCNTCQRMMLCPETICADKSCGGCCGECKITLNEKGTEQCSEIVSTCSETVCPDTMEWNACGSACPLTCGQSGLTECIAMCYPRCVCSVDTPYLLGDGSGCVAEKDCPATSTTTPTTTDVDCPLTMVFKTCGTACPKKCGVPEPMFCTMNCVAECQCEDPSLYYSEVDGNGICVEQQKCPTEATTTAITNDTTSEPTTAGKTEENDCGPLSLKIAFEVISQAVDNKIEKFCDFCRRQQTTMDECVEVSEFVDSRFEEKFDISLKDCFLDYCEMDECAAGVKLKDNWREAECGCDLFECAYVLGSSAHQFGIMIGIGFVMARFLSM